MCHRMPAPSGGVDEGPLCQHGGRCVELSHGSVGFVCECREGWGGAALHRGSGPVQVARARRLRCTRWLRSCGAPSSIAS
eukprot:COSAG01_NODE_226_length_21147_cov_59.226435_14_plen_80_part_00